MTRRYIVSYYALNSFITGGYVKAPLDPHRKQDEINRLREALDQCDAVLIGAGAGLSTAAGLTYTGERFEKYFSDFKERFGITDIYSGGFYPFPDIETYWAWWSRHIWVNRYGVEPGKPYVQLLELVKDKDYFVLTTNVDHQFQLAGFNKERLFYTQGDYGLFQCSHACTNETYDNEELVRKMLDQQENMRIPSELVPHCPHCGALMTTNLRADGSFVEDEGWHKAEQRYEAFKANHSHGKVLYWELGVGGNTPVIIKYPFWNYTHDNPDALYVCVNMGEAFVPSAISSQSILIDDDINKVLSSL